MKRTEQAFLIGLLLLAAIGAGLWTAGAGATSPPELPTLTPPSPYPGPYPAPGCALASYPYPAPYPAPCRAFVPAALNVESYP